MNTLEKVGTLTVMLLGMVGVFFIASTMFFFALGTSAALLRDKKPQVDVGPYIKAVEAGEEVILEDPEIANVVCFFVVMREFGGKMPAKLWDERMYKCIKERLNGPSSLPSKN